MANRNGPAGTAVVPAAMFPPVPKVPMPAIPTTAEERATRRNGIRGWKKLALMHDIAEGEMTLQEMGDKYGVTAPAVHQFKKRNASQIEEIRDKAAADLTAGLWIAKKANRLAEYEHDAELVNEFIETSDGPNRHLLRAKANILKNVAEEMGDLPARTNVVVAATTVNYVIEGVDMEALK